MAECLAGLGVRDCFRGVRDPRLDEPLGKNPATGEEDEGQEEWHSSFRVAYTDYDGPLTTKAQFMASLKAPNILGNHHRAAAVKRATNTTSLLAFKFCQKSPRLLLRDWRSVLKI